MNIKSNEDLSNYSTMRLGGTAKHLSVVHNTDELKESVEYAKQNDLPIRMIGGGSNIVFSEDGFDGLMIVNHIFGVEVVEDDETSATIKFGAGIRWDDAVALTVAENLSGIEALSLIPGTVGAAPVQNIGAYGQQLSDTLISVTAYDLESDELIEMPGDELGLGYRTSVFKHVELQRYLITAVTLKLSKQSRIKELYADVQRYFSDHKIDEITPQTVRMAVIGVREAKLPDPLTVANCGSFFANPVISHDEYEQLRLSHPEIDKTPEGWPQPPRWVNDDGTVKISAGWLMSEAGFKDHHDPETGMATWPKQSLVLINERAESPADLFTYRDKIVSTVNKKFGISLKQEPETI